MRARGRLSKADFEFDTKHPILLPSKHPATRLMMLKCHLDSYHQGVESLRHGLQQKFWILSLRNALRNIKNRCVPWRKYNAVIQAPIMAALPRERVVKADFLFTYVGVHYCRPIEVKYIRKTLKRWVCVFCCLSTRAIHLEMVFSLDTDPLSERNYTIFCQTRSSFNYLERQWDKLSWCEQRAEAVCINVAK